MDLLMSINWGLRAGTVMTEVPSLVSSNLLTGVEKKRDGNGRGQKQ